MKDLQELHAHTEMFARDFYSKHTGDFDMEPMLLAWTRRGDKHGVDYMVLLPTTESPLDAAAEALTTMQARNDDVEMVCFISASWKKDPAGERIGEVLIILAETKTEQLFGSINITRNDDRSIGLGELTFAQACRPRVPLLYQPTEH